MAKQPHLQVKQLTPRTHDYLVSTSCLWTRRPRKSCPLHLYHSYLQVSIVIMSTTGRLKTDACRLRNMSIKQNMAKCIYDIVGQLPHSDCTKAAVNCMMHCLMSISAHGPYKAQDHLLALNPRVDCWCRCHSCRRYHILLRLRRHQAEARRSEDAVLYGLEACL